MKPTQLKELFDKIASTSSRNEKIELLSQVDDNFKPTLVKLFDYTMSSWRLFYHSPVELDEEFTKPDDPIALEDFELEKPFIVMFNTLDKLFKNKMRGSSGLVLIQTFFVMYPEMIPFFNGVLDGDQGIGLQYNSVVKALPDLHINFFDVKLCNTFYNPTDISGPWCSEPKIDGLRLVLIPINGELQGFSRNGKPLYNLENIIKDIKENDTNWMENVYDGEAFATDWSSSMSITKTEDEHPDRDKLRLMIFDCIPLSEWESGEFKMKYVDRQLIIDGIARGCDYVESLNGQRINFTAFDDTPMDFYDNLVRVAIKNGHEGIVMKKMDSVYSFSRDNDWLKHKFFKTEDFRIIGMEEGRGRLKGTLGKVYLDVDGVEVGCGSGFDDAQRQEVWENQNKYMDTYIEVKYQVGVEDNDGKFDESYRTPDGSLRFPIFERFRLDK